MSEQESAKLAGPYLNSMHIILRYATQLSDFAYIAIHEP